MKQTEKVVVFQSRLRANAVICALEIAATRMYELASAMPGFVSYKEFTASDGESVSIVEFSEAASLLAWRNHPVHQRMQQQGREEFMAEYHIQVCRPEREYSFKGSD